MNDRFTIVARESSLRKESFQIKNPTKILPCQIKENYFGKKDVTYCMLRRELKRSTITYVKLLKIKVGMTKFEH